MESPAKRSRRQGSPVADVSRSGPEPEGKEAISALEVADVVRYGTGRRSRIDLTICSAGRRVRITGLPTKHVLSYRLIAQSAVEEGLVLPYRRFADREWRKVLARGMEHARVEPWLEGEEISEAIAFEIRARLDAGPRGDSASDLKAGKVVQKGDRLLMSPTALVLAVRDRLVDDVLSRETIEAAAAKHLGMEQRRPPLPDAQPRAWAFPMPLPAAREPEEVPEDAPESKLESKEDGLDESVLSKLCEKAPEALSMAPLPAAHAVDGNSVRSMDQGASPVSPLTRKRSKTGSDGPEEIGFPCDPADGPVTNFVSPVSTEGWESDPICREESTSKPGPVHGPNEQPGLSSGSGPMRAGSPPEENPLHAGLEEVESWTTSLINREITGSNGRRNGGPKS